jgi:hypothetical protein
MPVKVELLKMEAPEMYVSLTAKTAGEEEPIESLYMRNEPMPLSLDDAKEVGIMPAPRVVGPVAKYTSTKGAGVPMANALSRSRRPVGIGKGKELRTVVGKLNDPVPSTTKLPPDS